MKWNICQLIVLLFLGAPPLFAQPEITVLVTDSLAKEPLIGASVQVAHGAIAKKTNLDGKVILTFPKDSIYHLVVNYVGYQPRILTVKSPLRDSLMEVPMSMNSTTLDEVTVSSVRTHSTIENIPTKVEVLGLEEVSEENGIKPGNIMSLLSDVAGVQMQQVSASSGNTYARIQGLNGRYTQILKDGLPLFGGMSGGFSIMQIPPLDLKQIELIKGCGSTLYGADAIGGIINLISKSPAPRQELSMTLNQTTLSETNLNLYASRKYKGWGYTFFAGETYQSPTDNDKDGLSESPGINSLVIHPKLCVYLSPKSVLMLNYTGTFDKRKGGNMDYLYGTANESLYHVVNSTQRHSADIRWNKELSENSNLTLKCSNNFLNQDLNTKYYRFKAIQDIYFSEFSYDGRIHSMEWVAGVNLKGDLFSKQTSGFERIENYHQQTIGVFVQNTWTPTKQWVLETGFREDYHSKYGFFHLPRVALMYKITPQFTARINSGLGYKTPVQFSYIEPETDLAGLVATSLKPEFSKGLNVDLNYQHFFNDDFEITLNQSFFSTNIHNAVYDSSTVASKLVLINANSSLSTRGLQTYARTRYEDLEFYLGYVYTDVQQNYELVHKVPVATPRHQVSTTVFYDFSEHLVAGLESSYLASQLDQSYAKTKNYWLFAAMLQYKIRNYTFVLNGENLLDVKQSNYERIYDGTINNPVYHQLWAPVDGRVINLSVKCQLR